MLLGVCRRAGGLWVRSLGPVVLIAGAVLPTLVHGRNAGALGLQWGRIRLEIVTLVVCGVGLLVLGFAGVVLFSRLSLQPPLAASLPKEQWPLWIVFQFFCVAFPEEVFFRGYVLSNGLSLLRTWPRIRTSTAGVLAVVLSAGIFGLAHVTILASPAAAFSVLPALIFGWAFVKVDSLIPSIFLHGAANIGYAMITTAAA